MKKKEILKTIITIIVSVVLSSGISVYATSTYLYDSCDVSYDNASSGLNSSNVQSSLDELYMHATDYSELKNYFQNNPTSYFNQNDLRIGANDTSNHESYINFYSSNVNRGAIGISNLGDMQLVSKNASGVNGQGTLNLIANPVMINGENIDNKYANYVYISCTGGENSSNCLEAIKNKYNSLSGGTYVGEIKAGHQTGILIFKADAKYGTIVKFTYPVSANNKAEMASISIYNGTWGAWVSLH